LAVGNDHASPVYPDETILSDIWVNQTNVSFRCQLKESDVNVINNGVHARRMSDKRRESRTLRNTTRARPKPGSRRLKPMSRLNLAPTTFRCRQRLS
jgi:hypothetical protein